MTIHADIERMCALELHENITALYVAVLPIYRAVSGWTLNNTDPLLPEPYAVKVQLAEYRKLKVAAPKLTAFEAILLQAQPGDALLYAMPVVGSGLIVYNDNLYYTPTLFYGM